MPRISGGRRAWLGAVVASSMGLLVLPLAHAQRQRGLPEVHTSDLGIAAPMPHPQTALSAAGTSQTALSAAATPRAASSSAGTALTPTPGQTATLFPAQAPAGPLSSTPEMTSTPETTPTLETAAAGPSTGASSTAPILPLTRTQPVAAAIPSEAPAPASTTAQGLEPITLAPSVAVVGAVTAVEGVSENASPSNAASDQAKAAEAAARQAAAQARALYDYYTNGAQVTSVPTEGPAAAYFQNAAELLTVPSSSIAEESPDLGAGVP